MKECPKCNAPECMDIQQLNDKFEELQQTMLALGNHVKTISEAQFDHMGYLRALTMKVNELSDR